MLLPNTYYYEYYCQVLGGLMLGYTKEQFQDIISGLCGIEASGEDVASINKALDFLDGLWAEGYFD